MKRLLLSILLRDKFIGQLAGVLASAAAAWLFTLLPGAQALVEGLVVALLQLPEGTQLTQTGLAAALAPLILALLNAVVQAMVVRDNNEALDLLREGGVYDGRRDGWVGPLARRAVSWLIDRRPPEID